MNKVYCSDCKHCSLLLSDQEGYGVNGHICKKREIAIPVDVSNSYRRKVYLRYRWCKDVNHDNYCKHYEPHLIKRLINLITKKEEMKEMNNEIEFTKGPWTPCILNIKKEVIGEYVQRCVDSSPDDRFFFVSVEKEDGPADICHVGNGPTSEKNAFLIAAAPDLYNALLEVTKYYSGQGTGDIFNLGYGNDAKKERMVRNALKKARGEE